MAKASGSRAIMRALSSTLKPPNLISRPTSRPLCPGFERSLAQAPSKGAACAAQVCWNEGLCPSNTPGYLRQEKTPQNPLLLGKTTLAEGIVSANRAINAKIERVARHFFRKSRLTPPATAPNVPRTHTKESALWQR